MIFFKADVYIAHYNGQTINISRTIIDLPHDFYKFCFIGKETGNSNKEIEKTFKKLPGVDRWSISHNNAAKDIYLKSSAERTRVTDDTTLCIFQDKSDNEAVKIWTESDRDEDNILILQRFYFHSHNIDNLSDDLRKKFKRLSQISIDHIQTVLRNSDMIKKAFEEADKTIQKHMSREEIAKSKELAQIMLKVDAYYDNYDEMFPRSIYDEIRGSATTYNFIRINEGFSVQEAVDQYAKAKESYNSIIGEYGNVITYGLAGLNLNAFFFEKTIIFLKEDGVSEMENANEEFIDKCRQNGFIILGSKNGNLHDFVNGDDYMLNRDSYFKNDHDATYVFEMDLIKITKDS